MHFYAQIKCLFSFTNQKEALYQKCLKPKRSRIWNIDYVPVQTQNINWNKLLIALNWKTRWVLSQMNFRKFSSILITKHVNGTLISILST